MLTLKTIFRWLIPIALTVIGFWFAFKNVDSEQLIDSVRSVKLWAVLLALPAVVFSHLLRALRWRVLLERVKSDCSVVNLFSAVMVGYAASNVVPRSGELLRPLVIARREHLPFSSCLASVVVERVLDLFTLLFLIVMSLLFFQTSIESVFSANDISRVVVSLSVGAVASASLLLFFLFSSLGNRLVEKSLALVSNSVAVRVSRLVNEFKAGVASITSFSAWFRILILTALIWIFYIVPVYFTFVGFGLDQTHGLDFQSATIVLCVISIGITIAPTPGAVGIFHSLVKQALVLLWAIPDSQALAVATITHGVNFLVTSMVGGVFLIREYPLLKLKNETPTNDAVA